MDKKFILGGVIAAVGVLLVSMYFIGFGGEIIGESNGSSGKIKTSTVEIKNSKFVPDTIEIEAGEIVTWNNKDDSDYTLEGFGVEKKVEAGSKSNHHFNQPGTYHYNSKDNVEMNGTVIAVK